MKELLEKLKLYEVTHTEGFLELTLYTDGSGHLSNGGDLLKSFDTLGQLEAFLGSDEAEEAKAKHPKLEAIKAIQSLEAFLRKNESVELGFWGSGFMARTQPDNVYADTLTELLNKLD